MHRYVDAFANYPPNNANHFITGFRMTTFCGLFLFQVLNFWSLFMMLLNGRRVMCFAQSHLVVEWLMIFFKKSCAACKIYKSKIFWTTAKKKKNQMVSQFLCDLKQHCVKFPAMDHLCRAPVTSKCFVIQGTKQRASLAKHISCQDVVSTNSLFPSDWYSLFLLSRLWLYALHKLTWCILPKRVCDLRYRRF